jgi:hypothetical protein
VDFDLMHSLAPPALVVLVLASSCRTERDSPPTDPSRPHPPSSPVTIAPAATSARIATPAGTTCSAAAPPPSSRLVMERTECYGFCPAYTVEVHPDGTVLYEGRNYVRVRGPVRYAIPAAKAAALFQQAACAGTTTWKKRYDWPVTDNPTVTVTVNIGPTPVVVEDYPPCHTEGDPTPEPLCALEHAIDDAAGTSAYVECVGADGGLTYCSR